MPGSRVFATLTFRHRGAIEKAREGVDKDCQNDGQTQHEHQAKGGIVGVTPTRRVEVGDHQVDRSGSTCGADKHAEGHKTPARLGRLERSTPAVTHSEGSTAMAHVTARAVDRVVNPFGVPENPK